MMSLTLLLFVDSPGHNWLHKSICLTLRCYFFFLSTSPGFSVVDSTWQQRHVGPHARYKPQVALFHPFEKTPWKLGKKMSSLAIIWRRILLNVFINICSTYFVKWLNPGLPCVLKENATAIFSWGGGAQVGPGLLPGKPWIPFGFSRSSLIFELRKNNNTKV